MQIKTTEAIAFLATIAIKQYIATIRLMSAAKSCTVNDKRTTNPAFIIEKPRWLPNCAHIQINYYLDEDRIESEFIGIDCPPGLMLNLKHMLTIYPDGVDSAAVMLYYISAVSTLIRLDDGDEHELIRFVAHEVLEGYPAIYRRFCDKFSPRSES